MCCVSCASVSPERVAEVDFKPLNRHPVCVTLKITGGFEQTFFGDYEVPLDLYSEALRLVIRNSQVFSGICAAGQSGLALDIVVFRSSGQLGGSITQVKRIVPANWRLTDPASKRVLYQQRIDGIGVNKPVLGGHRVHTRAMEAGMQDNIVRGLQGISQLDLTGAK
jgi:hypothetical protein